MSAPLRQVAIALPLLLLTVASLRAQAPDTPAPFRPPAMRFDGGGLTLLEAVRITLENDPNVKLREADVALREGILRFQKGLFDPVIRAGGNYNRNQAELTQSEKEKLLENRSDLDKAIGEVTTLTQSLTAANALLQDKNQAYNNPAGMNLTTIKDQSVANQMSLLQSELILYRDILVSPNLTDPTVRTDIINLREATVGKHIDYFNSQQAEIAGLPAELQTDRNNLGVAPQERWERPTGVTVDFSKLFRNGLSVRPYVDLKHRAQNYAGKDQIGPEFGGLGIAPLSNGRIGFDVIVPLMRGRGKESVAAGEIASQFDVEASRLSLLFQQSQSVLATVQAYWRARALADQVEVLRESVDLQSQLGDRVRTQIAANTRAAGDGSRSTAATADARSRYESAQRQLTEARIQLAQEMGVALADALSIPLASDPYPQPPTNLQIDAQSYAPFIAEAIAHRFDRQSAIKVEASGLALVEGARRDTRPFLDATVSGWGTSVKESSVGYGSWVFRSASVGVTYEKPVGNNTAAGTLDAQRAALRQKQIDSADLERVIALGVIQLSESLRIAADRLRSAEEARNSYDETIRSEQARFIAGTTSLFDTILTEQQATGARLAYIAAREEYASILAALRHQAGLLVQDGTVDAAALFSVPSGLLRR